MLIQAPGVVADAVWQAIETRGRFRRFAPDEVLMHHGAHGRTCYAIRSGTVVITATSTQGATLVLGRRGPGHLVGELAALDDAPRSATVTAKTDVEAYELSWQLFQELLEEYPGWSVVLLQHLARRIRTLSAQYTLRSEDLGHRIVDLLATHVDETGDPVFRSSRSELAEWVGASREAVIRSLQQLRDRGVLAMGRGSVELLDGSSIAV